MKERVREIENRITDIENPRSLPKKWYDGDELSPLFESPPGEDDDEPSELFGTWRHEEPGGWVRVEGVMDSGASAPVAPPSMCPHAELRPSEGSRRGQTYTSASKHKMPNLGEQLLRAQTESGEDTTVLFAGCRREQTAHLCLCYMRDGEQSSLRQRRRGHPKSCNGERNAF